MVKITVGKTAKSHRSFQMSGQIGKIIKKHPLCIPAARSQPPESVCGGPKVKGIVSRDRHLSKSSVTWTRYRRENSKSKNQIKIIYFSRNIDKVTTAHIEIMYLYDYSGAGLLYSTWIVQVLCGTGGGVLNWFFKGGGGPREWAASIERKPLCISSGAHVSSVLRHDK